MAAGVCGAGACLGLWCFGRTRRTGTQGGSIFSSLLAVLGPLAGLAGAVGAGGIGYELEYSFGLLEYHRALTAVLIIMAMVFGTERLSFLLRSKIKMEGALK